MKYIISILSIIITTILPSYSQMDSDGCHFWSDWSLFNPANIKPYYAGFLLVRGQQIGFEGQPYTINAATTFYSAKWHSQIGGQITLDYAGYTTVGKGNLKYAFSIGSEYDRLNFGLACGVSYFYYDNSKVEVDNTLDDVAFASAEECIKPNYNFGVEWVHKVARKSFFDDEITVGASVMNMEDYLSRQDNRNTINSMFAYSSYRYRTMKRIDLLGGLLFQYYDTNRLQSEIHGSVIYTAADDGGLETYDKVAIGFSYRHNLQGYGNNDITANVGWGLSKHFYIGYAFDFVVEDNIRKPFSTHEFFIQYRFINRKCVNGRFGKIDTFKPLGGR